jgi:hypothetical protein
MLPHSPKKTTKNNNNKTTTPPRSATTRGAELHCMKKQRRAKHFGKTSWGSIIIISGSISGVLVVGYY